MIDNPDLTGLLYLAAIICFVLALRFLSSPKHARRGNWLGGVGMLVAIGIASGMTETYSQAQVAAGLHQGVRPTTDA